MFVVGTLNGQNNKQYEQNEIIPTLTLVQH